MKLLVVCSTLNLDYPYGATPAIWQLLKALFEIGCDTIVIPYRGSSIRSLWWRCYPNPTAVEGELYAHSGLHIKKSSGFKRNLNEKVVPRAANFINSKKWRKLFAHILKIEKNIDAILFLGIPINHFNALASYIRKEFSCPLVYYDLDVPTSLPTKGGFSFNYYQNADLANYDAVICPSEGAKADLLSLGIKKVFFVHFAVDPDLFFPIDLEQDIDIFFYGTSDYNRERSIRMLISEPSEKLKANFIVSGINYQVDLSMAKKIPMIPFSKWRNYACRSKVNLNIPRENHAKTYATSTSRPFELAAMGCCIVSSPYNGLEKWFDINKEIYVAKDAAEAIELYRWLLDNADIRTECGIRARQRVIKEHTFRHRADSLLQIFNNLS